MIQDEYGVGWTSRSQPPSVKLCRALSPTGGYLPLPRPKTAGGIWQLHWPTGRCLNTPQAGTGAHLMMLVLHDDAVRDTDANP